MGRVTAAIGLAQERFDGKRHIELIKQGPGSAWIVPSIIELIGITDPCAIAIDPGSPAGSILPDLETAMTQAGVDLSLIVKMSARDVAQAFGMIYDAATSTDEGDRSVTHLGQSELDVEVAAAGKRPVGDGHAWDRKNASVGLTGIISVTHALFGLAAKGSEAPFVMPMMGYA
jgi:hypothetical protein